MWVFTTIGIFVAAFVGVLLVVEYGQKLLRHIVRLPEEAQYGIAIGVLLTIIVVTILLN